MNLKLLQSKICINEIVLFLENIHTLLYSVGGLKVYKLKPLGVQDHDEKGSNNTSIRFICFSN